MSFRPRKPEYVYGFYLAIPMLFLALLDYGRRDKSGLLFDLSMAFFLATAASLFYFIAGYNERHPASPIRLWLRQLCGAVLAFVIGAYNVYATPDWIGRFNNFLWFLMSVFLAANAGYYYVKDKSRVEPKYLDPDVK
jgi:hypothetical protein